MTDLAQRLALTETARVNAEWSRLARLGDTSPWVRKALASTLPAKELTAQKAAR